MEVVKSENTGNEVLTKDNDVETKDGGIQTKEDLDPSHLKEVMTASDEKSSLNCDELSPDCPEESKDDEVVEKHDPYAYLNRDEFSSENFKIEIQNLPKYFGVGVRMWTYLFTAY